MDNALPFSLKRPACSYVQKVLPSGNMPGASQSIGGSADGGFSTVADFSGLLSGPTRTTGGMGSAGQFSSIPAPTGGPTLAQLNTHQEPYVDIVEQPKAHGLRFRYKCEGRSAGSIPGESSTNEHRTYPTIKICNMDSTAAIAVVSCVDKDGERPRPHPHSLVGKDCQKGVCTVKVKGTNTISFPNLGIQCATKKAVKDDLKQRENIRVDPYQTGFKMNTQAIDLNQVRLCFQVFLPDRNHKFTRVLPPVVSQHIFDKKAVNDLVICRLSKQAGSVRGGDEVFLLCEKVNKDDIQVRFFEIDPARPDEVRWEAYADFGQGDVHRQYAIVFKTPTYRDIGIRSPAQVLLQLKRPTDGQVSDPKPFQFIPDDPDPDGVAIKKRRKALNFKDFFTDNSSGPTETDSKVSVQQLVKDRLKSKATRKQKQAAPATVTTLPEGTMAQSLQPEAAAAVATGLPQYSMQNMGLMAQVQDGSDPVGMWHNPQLSMPTQIPTSDNMVITSMDQGSMVPLVADTSQASDSNAQTLFTSLTNAPMDGTAGGLLDFMGDDIMTGNSSSLNLPSFTDSELGLSSGLVSELANIGGQEMVDANEQPHLPAMNPNLPQT